VYSESSNENHVEGLNGSPAIAKPMLGEVELLWLERLKKYLSDYKYDYVYSWRLRCEYENEGITTPKINYILSKLVAKGILKKETTRSYTKFSLNLA